MRPRAVIIFGRMNNETLVGNLITHRFVIQGMLTAMVGNATVAEDLFQEVSIVMMRKHEEADDDCRFVAWARAIAVNVVRTWRRSQSRRPVQYLDDAVLDTVAAAFEGSDEWEERREALRHCAANLPDKDRVLLRRRYDEDVPVEELATSMAMSRGALDTVLYRLRKALLACVAGRLAREGS